MSRAWVSLSPLTPDSHAKRARAQPCPCETSNFHHDTVSLQGLIRTIISHSTMHPMLPPPVCCPPPGSAGAPGAAWGRQPPAAVHSCRRVKQREHQFHGAAAAPAEPQRAGSTQKLWVQLNSNRNQIKTREKGFVPSTGNARGELGLGIL